MSNKLTREMILDIDDIKKESVPVDEWQKGAKLTVTSWSARTRDKFDSLLFKLNGKDGAERDTRPLVVALSVIDDETGELMFTLDDIEALAKKNQAPINRLFQAATRLNPLTDKSIISAAKNS